MSVNYTAYACIGIRISSEKLYRTVRVPGCSCGTAIKGAKFCPSCGKPAIREEKEPIAGFDPHSWPQQLHGLPLVRGTLDECLGGARFFIACTAFSETDGDEAKCILAPDIEASRAMLREKLEPLGLWSESEFGLWVVLHCSY